MGTHTEFWFRHHVQWCLNRFLRLWGRASKQIIFLLCTCEIKEKISRTLSHLCQTGVKLRHYFFMIVIFPFLCWVSEDINKSCNKKHKCCNKKVYICQLICQLALIFVLRFVSISNVRCINFSLQYPLNLYAPHINIFHMTIYMISALSIPTNMWRWY